MLNDNCESKAYTTIQTNVVTWTCELCLKCMPEGCRLKGREHTFQTKPECPVLQLINYVTLSIHIRLIACTCRVINHSSQYKCNRWIYYMYIHAKNFNCWSAATTFWFCLVTRQILDISQRIWLCKLNGLMF